MLKNHEIYTYIKIQSINENKLIHYNKESLRIDSIEILIRNQKYIS